MAQRVLPFEYQSEKNSTGLTALAGLPVFLELMAVMGLPALIRQHLDACGTQGWTDVQHIVSLLCLHLAGGDCVDDLDKLDADDGFGALLEEVETHGLRARKRRALKNRWRIDKKRSVASPSAMRRWLEQFDDADESALSQQGSAYLPAPNEHLLGLKALVAATAKYAQLVSPQPTATLDLDATLIASHKREALYCYKKFKAYQPLNVFWDEQSLMLTSEFRDGNCPARWRNLEVLKEALRLLPDGVTKVRVRADTATYLNDVLKYLAEGKNKRYGVIEFAISCDVTAAFKRAVAEVKPGEWKPLLAVDEDGDTYETGQEYAEVCYVPDFATRSKNGPTYRFLAIREPLEQPELFEEQIELPFATMSFEKTGASKLSGIVTNIDYDTMDGGELVRWQRQRCGNSEKAHSILKSDLGAGQMPSGLFGANAAWWQIALIAMNLHVIMQTKVLAREGLGQRLKAVRFGLIRVPGRVTRHARRLTIRLPENHPSRRLIERIRQRLEQMSTGPPGPWLSAP